MSDQWELFIQKTIGYVLTLAAFVTVAYKGLETLKVKFRESSTGAEAFKKINERFDALSKDMTDLQSQVRFVQEEISQLRDRLDKIKEVIDKDYKDVMKMMIENKK